MATKNDGRVVHFGSGSEDWYDVTGCLEVSDILARGIDEVRIDRQPASCSPTARSTSANACGPITAQGKIVLYVTRNRSAALGSRPPDVIYSQAL